MVVGSRLSPPESLVPTNVPIKKLGDLLQRFALPPTFPHQRFLLLAVINPASLFHLQHSHCSRSLLVCCIHRLNPPPEPDGRARGPIPPQTVYWPVALTIKLLFTALTPFTPFAAETATSICLASGTEPPSGLRQTDCILFSLARARVTFARMSEALAVQMNGFGSRLCFTMYCSIVLDQFGYRAEGRASQLVL